jgi:hypothetical protein
MKEHQPSDGDWTVVRLECHAMGSNERSSDVDTSDGRRLSI